ncbi:MAG: glycosyltransferase [Burkholderiales bacterium]
MADPTERPPTAAREPADAADDATDTLASLREARDALAAEIVALTAQRARGSGPGTAAAPPDRRHDELATAYRALLRYHVARAHALPPPAPSAAGHCASPTLRFNLESPLETTAASGDVSIKGWCFDLAADVSGVDVWIDDERCDCVWGLVRDDVAASYPEVSRAQASGFAARVELSPGPHFLSVRVAICGMPEAVVHERVFSVADGQMLGVLEAPAMSRLHAGSARFSGWCWHRDAGIASLTLHVGGRSAVCRYGLIRDDVAHSFPDVATARRSGFACEFDLAVGRGEVVLEAQLDDGRHAQLVLGADVRVRRSLVAVPVLAPVGARVERVRQVVDLATGWVRTRGRLPRWRELPALARKAHAVLRPHARAASPSFPAGWRPPAVLDRYEAWLALNRFTPERERELRERLAACAQPLPSISVVMPVYEPDLALLDRAIASVEAQVAGEWELCIADDASRDPAVRQRLAAAARRNARIRFVGRPVNGNISAATNSAAALATGDYLLFLDQDDELAPDALGEIALALSGLPDADLLYTDDDKIDAGGRRYAPQFKPDWSPELLLSYMYVSHALVVRRELFLRLGGLRVGFEGSQDHDFALRAGEHARRVVHVPRVLYHWRAAAGSTAVDANAKPHGFAAGERAVRDALARRGSDGTAARPEWAVRVGVGIYAHEFPDDGPRVTIIVPTRNQLAILRRCIESLAATTYRNRELIVVDNDSDDPATLAYLRSLPHRVLRIANPDGSFNFAHLNNRAADAATGEYVLFLNNDTEVLDPRWLSRMVGYARLPGVGAVGARLLYPDRRVQHAGVVHGYYDGLVGPAFKLAAADDHGYLSYAKVARNYSAVTAACMLTKRSLFQSLRGFDEASFAVAYNDVDYCYRLVDAGHRCVYAPGAELLHHEGYSRGFDDRPQEVAAFRRRHGRRVDPYYSPHLSLDDERFAIAARRYPPRRRSRPIRALMCGFTLNWEGAPYQQLELTLALKRAGVVDPVVFATRDGPLRDEYERNGIAVHVLAHPLRDAGTPADYDRAIDGFAAWIRAQDAELVYANTMESFFVVAAAERAALPSVWNIHESENWQTYFAHLHPTLAGRALDCFAHPYRVVFVAHATRERYRPLESRHHFATIHNGLDPARISGTARPRDACREQLAIAPNDVVLLVLGTVCARKGQHDLVQAVAGLDENLRGRLRCLIVGDRPSDYSRDLHQRVAMLPPSLRERVSVVPETGDTALYYGAADVFVCTSRVESYPRVILEAMAHGLPIVTTPVFGIREQVKNGVNGVFYEPGDIAALRIAIARLVQDDALRARLAQSARPVLEGLTSFDDMVERYAQVFREACVS